MHDARRDGACEPVGGPPPRREDRGGEAGSDCVPPRSTLACPATCVSVRHIDGAKYASSPCCCGESGIDALGCRGLGGGGLGGGGGTAAGACVAAASAAVAAAAVSVGSGGALLPFLGAAAVAWWQASRHS